MELYTSCITVNVLGIVYIKTENVLIIFFYITAYNLIKLYNINMYQEIFAIELRPLKTSATKNILKCSRNRNTKTGHSFKFYSLN